MNYNEGQNHIFKLARKWSEQPWPESVGRVAKKNGSRERSIAINLEASPEATVADDVTIMAPTRVIGIDVEKSEVRATNCQHVDGVSVMAIDEADFVIRGWGDDDVAAIQGASN